MIRRFGNLVVFFPGIIFWDTMHCCKIVAIQPLTLISFLLKGTKVIFDHSAKTKNNMPRWRVTYNASYCPPRKQLHNANTLEKTVCCFWCHHSHMEKNWQKMQCFDSFWAKYEYEEFKETHIGWDHASSVKWPVNNFRWVFAMTIDWFCNRHWQKFMTCLLRHLYLPNQYQMPDCSP